jgi:GT2 family glycosyltransferase
MRVAVGVATTGRREQIKRTLEQFARQITSPSRLLICPGGPGDFDETYRVSGGPQVELVFGRKGSCTQRNAIIDAAYDADVIVFFDDDFYPAPDYIQRVIQLFTTHPRVVLATHWPILDGAQGPGITHEDAVRALESSVPIGGDSKPSATYGGYGCNMSIRMDVIREHRLRFDESLPLYGWLEDIELSRRVALWGDVVSDPSLRGVHLGTKNGRPSGVRLGYSQIANPVYMIRKGSGSPQYALRHAAKNLAANVARAPSPEHWIDRRGRLKGNLLALKDLITGNLHPERILQF